MTTSNPTQQEAPTYNSEGELVWKPSVGVVFEPAKNNAQSYGGIVGALQDAITASGSIPKSYPYSFAGIIAAIQDLDFASDHIPVHPGPIPPGTEINIDGDLNILVPARDGQLWFDTRQGRLFVANDQEWWQTNGADGLAIISNTAPDTANIVPGQFWWKPDTQLLFVYDAGWDETTREGGSDPGWKLVAGAEPVTPTTAITILSNNGPKQRIGDHINQILPEPDLENLNVQADLNGYYYECLLELEDAIGEFNPVLIGDTPPPDQPKPGQLWYDTESLELSIWYVDDDGGQWVPTAASYTFDEDLATLRTSLEAESRVREQALYAIQEEIDAINAADAEEVATLTAAISELQSSLALKVSTSTLNSLATSDSVDSKIESISEALTHKINQVETSIPSLEAYATSSDLSEQKAELETAIEGKTSMGAVVNFIETTLADADFSTKADLNQRLENLSDNFLTYSGGTLSGSLKVNKVNISQPAIDFSDSPAAGKPAFKFATQNPGGSSYATFGTTNKHWEYAWQFTSDEDFCWMHDDNKVFSITKEGPACSTLYLGSSISTDHNGRYISNKIDVRERLEMYQTAFTNLRQGVFAANDFETLKANILSALASV